MNTLTVKEKETVQLYAHQCFYSEGEAVLKARDIWTFFNPSEVYDDRAECVNITNKGSNFDFEGYMSTLRLLGHNNIQANIVTVFPNPAKGDITLVCSENGSGQFMLHDASGRLLLSVMLNDQSTNHSIHLPEYLSNGLYTYVYQMNGGTSFTGKLSICK